MEVYVNDPVRDGVSRRGVLTAGLAIAGALAFGDVAFAGKDDNPVRSYLQAAHDDAKAREELHEIHGRGSSEETLGAIVSHAAKMGFHFTRDELVTFVVGSLPPKSTPAATPAASP